MIDFDHVSPDPHGDQPVVKAGVPVERATGAIVALHGRGSSAEDILGLAAALDPGGFAYLAPQAAGHTWYPNRFTAPRSSNEPFLSSALGAVAATVARATVAGIPHERIVLLGFSQGACLAIEYAARHARRWGGVIVLSGGLIGPPGTPRDYPGSFAGTPIFLGCSDVDAHIPVERVHESAEVVQRMGGDVDKRIYPGMGHTVNQDEVEAVRALLACIAAGNSSPSKVNGSDDQI
ncbi:MAG TPA: alpha/beta fold hydrolase [Thermomicrobiales bacterium]|nr:alpha/beta fold hydrolase [Thermomicrobiales bacterium]